MYTETVLVCFFKEIFCLCCLQNDNTATIRSPIRRVMSMGYQTKTQHYD